MHLFPEVNTSLATTSKTTTTDSDLEGYDEEQIRLMEEVCIVLDENDIPIGSASKKVCEFPISLSINSKANQLDRSSYEEYK